MKKIMSEDAEVLTIYLDDSDERPTLKKLQEFVGGYIEIVSSVDMKKQVVVDEEGLIKGKPYNEDASEEAGMNLVGDAVILSGNARVD